MECQTSTVIRFIYTCGNCSKEYEGKKFHCYNLNFCCKKCMNTKVKPIREEETVKEKERQINKLPDINRGSSGDWH
jgi:hypothetical protein